MATRDEISADVRLNLDDVGISFYTPTDISNSIQDAYDDLAVLSGCINKIATVNFQNDLSYYDMPSLVADYFAPVAIFNNNNNRWLCPVSRKKLDNVRRDWEIWEGEPTFFCPLGPKYLLIVPRLTVATGNFTLYYKALANTLSGSSVPLIHSDKGHILEHYATGDLLDQQQEYKKAKTWWDQYFKEATDYRIQIGKLAGPDYIPALGKFDPH